MAYDDNKPFEKKEMEGYLWHETDSKVIRKGSVLMKKADSPMGKDEEIYTAIVKTTINGQDKYEFMVSAGLLYVNSEEDKRDAKSPDISGPITLNGKQYKLGGWKNVSSNDTEYTKVSLKAKEEKDNRF